MHPIIAELLANARQQDVQRSVRAASRAQRTSKISARRHHSLRRHAGQD